MRTILLQRHRQRLPADQAQPGHKLRPWETADDWLDADQQRSWRALVMGMTLLIDRLDDDLRRSFGLSLTEYEILVRLSEAEDRRLRMAQLADALAHSRSRVTHTVARLEKAELVARSATPEDGRGIVCEMTDKGWDLLVRMAPDPRAGRPRPPRRPGQRRGLRRPRPGDGRRLRPPGRRTPRDGDARPDRRRRRFRQAQSASSTTEASLVEEVASDRLETSERALSRGSGGGG